MKKVYFVVFRPTLFYKLLLICVVIILSLSLISSGRSLYEGTKSIFMEEGSSEAQPTETQPTVAKLSIVIDDFGSTKAGVEEMMAIDRHLTFAVIPFLDYSNKNAVEAHEKGFEVIAHLPMEPKKGKRSWLGPNPILSGMDYETVRKIVKESIENVPFAVGANIHMGSKASSEEVIMSAVIDEIKERNLLFLDSCTASKPIAKDIALKKEVLCYERDVFLDGQQPKAFVIKRLKQAADVALKKGYAIAIGHVGIEGGKVTAEAITEMIPELDKNNIKLVFLSELK